MRAGKLRYRVSIQKPSTDRGSTGQVIPGRYDHVAWSWADIAQIAASERSYAEQIAPRAKLQVEMRYRDDIDSGMRIMDGARALNIEGIVDPDGRKVKLRLFCSEVV